MTRAERQARDLEIVAMRSRRMPLKMIGNKFDLTLPAVWAALKRAGFKYPEGEFRCGHLKTPENSKSNNGQLRCRTCAKERASSYYRTVRRKMKNAVIDWPLVRSL